MYLEHACLTYRGDDGPERRERVRTLLVSDPATARTSIHAAAAAGDADAVAQALRADPGCVSRTGGPRNWAPILYLCYSRVQADGADSPAALRALLDSGADPAASFALGPCTFMALTGVIGEGEGGLDRLPSHADARTLVPMLLGAGAPANDPQAVYNTVLSPGDEWLELLIEHGLASTDEINWDMGVTPTPRTLDFVLCGAAKDGHAARLDLVLRAGADANATNPYDGRCALLGARLARHAELADVLIRHGARMPQLPPQDRFRLALLAGDRSEARSILDRVASGIDDRGLDDRGLVADLAALGFIDALQLAFDLGVGPNTVDRNGATALHQAAYSGRSDVIELLLQAGADRTIRDRHYDGTPSDWARHAGHHALAESLAVEPS